MLTTFKKKTLCIIGTCVCCLLMMQIVGYRTYLPGKVVRFHRVETKNTRHNKWSNFDRKTKKINCRAVLEGDKIEIKKALDKQTAYMANYTVLPDDTFINITKNCDEFKSRRAYQTTTSAEEEQFPIAFSILLYKEAVQAERLLRAIYRPQNHYCIHVDGKSPRVLHAAMAAIANCFDNVFIVSKTERVVYQGFSRLQADLNCMHDLVYSNRTWMYFLNLPSQEFPLKSNAEMVKILKIYNGANDIEGITKEARKMNKRYKSSYEVSRDDNGKERIVRTSREKGPPPHSITVVKGSAYGTFSRKCVEFILTNKKVLDFLEWCKDVKSPDEYFWATLNHLKINPQLQTPGGYKGEPESKQWLSTYTNWREVPCHGEFVRGTCVFGIQDLPLLVSHKEFFANKFHIDYQPFAMDCLEEWVQNKSSWDTVIDLEFYRKLSFIF